MTIAETTFEYGSPLVRITRGWWRSRDRLTLDREFTDELVSLFSNNIKNDIVTRAMRAKEMHAKYIAGRSFGDNFEDLLMSLGGSRSSVAKWVGAGQAIERVKKVGERHVDQLPTSSRDALYEIHLLTGDELHLSLRDTYTRKSRWEPRSEWRRPETATPVIHPGATAKSIKFWRDRWRCLSPPEYALIDFPNRWIREA